MFNRDVSCHLFNAAHICLNPAPPRRNPHSSRKASRNERELPVPVFSGVVTPSRSPTSCFHVSPSATIAKLHPQIFCGRHLLLPLPAAPPPPPYFYLPVGFILGCFCCVCFWTAFSRCQLSSHLCETNQWGTFWIQASVEALTQIQIAHVRKKSDIFCCLLRSSKKKKTPKKK